MRKSFRDMIDLIDSYLVAYFGNSLEFRSLEFFLSWGRATKMPVLGRFFKSLFDWFCRYYAGFLIPYDGSVIAGTVIMPYENILEFVKRAKIARVLPCGCRTMRQPTDLTIPRATCMSFYAPEGKTMEDIAGLARSMDELADAKSSKGKWVEAEKILKILAECEEYGLVHQIMCFSNPQGRKMYVLCNCDGEKCIPNYLTTRYNVPFVRSSGFMCQIESPEACTGCDLCVKRCIYKAAAVDNGIPSVNEDKCLGCGLCVSKCPAKIRKMVRQPKEPFNKLTSDYLKTDPDEAMVTGEKGEFPRNLH